MRKYNPKGISKKAIKAKGGKVAYLREFKLNSLLGRNALRSQNKSARQESKRLVSEYNESTSAQH